jgi:hypothetical protein
VITGDIASGHTLCRFRKTAKNSLEPKGGAGRNRHFPIGIGIGDSTKLSARNGRFVQSSLAAMQLHIDDVAKTHPNSQPQLIEPDQYGDIEPAWSDTVNFACRGNKSHLSCEKSS